jgi:hypothetical protein
MPQPKKKFMVVKATQNDISGVSVAGRTLRFGEKTNAFQVTDAGLAREIEAAKGTKWTGDVVVIPVDSNPEPGHPRTFTVPEMPWKKKGTTDGRKD